MTLHRQSVSLDCGGVTSDYWLVMLEIRDTSVRGCPRD